MQSETWEILVFGFNKIRETKQVELSVRIG